uniref:Uncharacterized protein n=1 Tax=Octopus bimaculoides TaxID=37653 RepID=A0A0L8FV63_OCTBM
MYKHKTLLHPINLRTMYKINIELRKIATKNIQTILCFLYINLHTTAGENT